MCPSCLAPLVDPWGRFEQFVRGGIIILCMGGALYLAGMTVRDWIASIH